MQKHKWRNGTSDFAITLYKRTSCSFAEWRLFKVDAKPGVSIDSAFTASY